MLYRNFFSLVESEWKWEGSLPESLKSSQISLRLGIETHLVTFSKGREGVYSSWKGCNVL